MAIINPEQHEMLMQGLLDEPESESSNLHQEAARRTKKKVLLANHTIASMANVKQLVLSHRMNRTLGHEQTTSRLIRNTYAGRLHYADDMQCFQP